MSCCCSGRIGPVFSTRRTRRERDRNGAGQSIVVLKPGGNLAAAVAQARSLGGEVVMQYKYALKGSPRGCPRPRSPGFSADGRGGCAGKPTLRANHALRTRWPSQTVGPAALVWCGRLDAQQPDERRRVLLFERHEVEHAQLPSVATRRRWVVKPREITTALTC
jgi:hypothetical protein